MKHYRIETDQPEELVEQRHRDQFSHNQLPTYRSVIVCNVPSLRDTLHAISTYIETEVNDLSRNDHLSYHRDEL